MSQVFVWNVFLIMNVAFFDRMLFLALWHGSGFHANLLYPWLQILRYQPFGFHDGKIGLRSTVRLLLSYYFYVCIHSVLPLTSLCLYLETSVPFSFFSWRLGVLLCHPQEKKQTKTKEKTVLYLYVESTFRAQFAQQPGGQSAIVWRNSGFKWNNFRSCDKVRSPLVKTLDRSVGTLGFE